MRLALNGWQRLWVVASGIYLILVATCAVMIIPSELPTEDTITRAWRHAALAIDREAEPKWRDARTGGEPVRNPDLSNERFTVSDPVIGPEYDDPAVSDRDLIAAIERKYEPPKGFKWVEPSPALAKLSALSSEYKAKLASLPRQRLQAGVRMTGVALTVWLLPSLAVYALGMGVGWIVRGFRHQARTAK
jgi:hypothetical protein